MIARTDPADTLPASNASLRDRLKTETAAAHAAVDARFSAVLAEGAAGYARFLSMSAQALLPLEADLEAAGVADLLPDWSRRSRAAALRADLAIFGLSTPATRGEGLREAGEAYLFGVLYVLEGSRLGAKFLARRVAAQADPRVRAAMRYLRHGDGEGLWPSFLRRLEASAAARHAPDRAVAGARAGFHRFGASAEAAPA